MAVEVIVVLGATVRPDGTPSDTLRARILAAAAAYRRTPVPIIVTGAGEAHAMAKALVALGIPDSAISRETSARTTRENAQRTAERVSPGTSVLVVTQPAHQRRALALFRKAGLQPEPCLAAQRWGFYARGREYVAYVHHVLAGWL